MFAGQLSFTGRHQVQFVLKTNKNLLGQTRLASVCREHVLKVTVSNEALCLKAVSDPRGAAL